MQQINLYLPEFQPNREPMRAIHMLWGLAAIILLLIIFSIFSESQLKKLQQQALQEQQAQEGLKQQLQVLSGKKPAATAADLDAQIEKLQKDLQRRQQILEMIAHQNLGNDKGFSAQLKTLAQASLPTVSVETFSLQKGGTYAEFSGKTSSADQIPLYLQKLHADPSFAQVGVGVLSIQRDEKNSGLLQFTLAKAEDENTTTSTAKGKH